ncbi:sulfur carrier protein ThiS [Halomonas sp. XH26]|uniref:Thiamine biosynthesis protein ThiS n=1 Tax=Vreelandella alkaliphila TaxID=272774 RepID=A0ABX4HN44_9GAMM|nr:MULTISPECIES: sulfur carrier protein ThiS [Halomonas]PAU73830.1 thiamine biosynthesis protein ThiS [Halomonas humidisoli]UTA80359.1 sulfur carrier protein ThiS [Halomonas sp. XH26]
MKVWINGEVYVIESGMTIKQLLVVNCLDNKRVAVELNKEIVPRSQHETHYLRAGDLVEIVHAIGGG